MSSQLWLNDQVIDYYDSKDQKKVPRQDWMKEKMQEDYWEKGTQSRKSKEQWFKVNVNILMQRMNHSSTDLHVLQWRHGCEIEESNGTVTFLKGISEYSYDGSEFLSFDIENMRWIAIVPQAEPTKRKWDDVPILNQYTKGYLEKECVDWLTKYLECRKEALKKHTPTVCVSVRKHLVDSTKLTLTCLATGFYPKDVTVSLRRFTTSLPEQLLTSSGFRPNEDGTYQLRKSVEIQEDDTAVYNCHVTHSSLEKPITVEMDKKSSRGSCSTSTEVVGSIPAVAAISEPKNLRVLETSSTSVKIRWDKATGAIDGYIILTSPSQTDGSNARKQIRVPSGDDSAEVGNLKPGSVYIISLVAEKGRSLSLPVSVLATTNTE